MTKLKLKVNERILQITNYTYVVYRRLVYLYLYPFHLKIQKTQEEK